MLVLFLTPASSFPNSSDLYNFNSTMTSSISNQVQGRAHQEKGVFSVLQTSSGDV